MFCIQYVLCVEVGGVVFHNKASNLTNYNVFLGFFPPHSLQRRPTGLSPEIAPLQQQAKWTSVVRGLYR